MIRVTNKARVERSIVETTLVKEISTYCSYYFTDHDSTKSSHKGKYEVREDNSSSGRLSIVDSLGRALGRRKRRTLDPNECKAAHN